MVDPIKIDGLAQFQRNLKKLDSNLPKALRVAFNECANIIIGHAQPRVPKKSGRAAASIKARSTQKQVRISAGGNRAPYYPWLDFGGRVGRNKSVHRAFLKDGRYIYDAYFKNQDKFHEALNKALLDVAAQAGVVVD